MRIIPAIDIMDGKCVRLTQGDFGKVKVYDQNPLEVAMRFQEADLEYVHIVDLDGAQSGRVMNWEILEKIRANTALRIDFGGGVKTTEDVEQLLELNIDQINAGSVAAKEPDKFMEWIDRFGADNFILSADIKGKIVKIAGWKEKTKLSVYELIQRYEVTGLQHVTCTDISADGMLQGPNFAIYKRILNKFPNIKLTASGGVSSVEDIEKLKYINVAGVIIGKAIYEGNIKLEELAQFKS